MANRYTLVITFNGEEDEAPEDWERGAISNIAHLIHRGQTSGQATIWGDDVGYGVSWTLEAEDE